MALREQLDEARADVERLQAEAANAASEASGLRDEMAATRAAAATSSEEAGALREQLATANGRLRAAADGYRDLVVKTEPPLPAELIAGEDVDAVDASVAAAREIVGRVRSHIEAQAQSSRVPAGAPARGAPEISSMTPEQKIRYGLAAGR